MLGVVANDTCTCCCHQLSVVVDFILLFDIYCFFILSWPIIPTQYLFLVLTPTCIFFFCYFVECSKCAIDFDSPSTLASLQHIRIQGELWFLARAGFSHSRLDVLKSDMDHPFTYFVFLNTLRLGNLRIDILDVMTSRFWE